MSLKTDRKLSEKKYRDETGLFMVEGKKGILELLASNLTVERVYTTLEESAVIDEAAKRYRTQMGTTLPEVIIVTQNALESAGTVESNNAGVAIAKQVPTRTVDEILEYAKKGFVLVLDAIQDPGNLGTIIRTADWFGVAHIITSLSTVDSYNPKVIRSSMGSFTRVHVYSIELESLLSKAEKMDIPSYGAFITGTNVYETKFGNNGLIVLGSESHGVSDSLRAHIEYSVTIPRYGDAESLNVAIATGVILAEIRRG